VPAENAASNCERGTSLTLVLPSTVSTIFTKSCFKVPPPLLPEITLALVGGVVVGVVWWELALQLRGLCMRVEMLPF